MISIDEKIIKNPWFSIAIADAPTKGYKVFPMVGEDDINNKKNHKKKLTNSTLIKKSKKIYDEKYSYDLLDVRGYKEKIKLICNNCGEIFEVYPTNHLYNNCGCNKCYGKKIILTNNEFIKKCDVVHNNSYDYSNTIFIKNSVEIEFVCAVHGKIKQYPLTHLNRGCPLCNKGYLGENKIYSFLIENKINFKHQKSFKKCKSKNKLTFDFYLIDKNILIEFDGEQHYKPIDFFGGMKSFLLIQKHDKIKNSFAKNNGFKLIRIPFFEFNNIENILNNVI